MGNEPLADDGLAADLDAEPVNRPSFLEWP